MNSETLQNVMVISMVATPLFVLSTVFILWKLRSVVDSTGKKIEGVQSTIPNNSILSRLGDLSDTLNQSLNTTHQVIQKTPVKLGEIISNEVDKGLKTTINSIEELSQNLTKSHGQFQTALTALAEPGHLTEIAEQFGETAISFKNLSTTFDANETTIAGILNNTGSILENWSSQRTLFEETYEKLAHVLLDWAQKDQVHRGEIENRLMSRFDEMQTIERELSEKFNELKSENLKLITSVAELRSTLHGTVQTMADVTDNQKTATAHQIDTSKNIEALGARVGETLNGIQGVLQDSRRLFSSFENQSQSTLGAMESMLNKMEQRQNSIFENMEKQQALVVNSMQSAIEAHEQFIEEYQNSLAGAASEGQQKLQSWFLGILVMIQIMMGGTLVFVLLKA